MKIGEIFVEHLLISIPIKFSHLSYFCIIWAKRTSFSKKEPVQRGAVGHWEQRTAGHKRGSGCGWPSDGQTPRKAPPKIVCRCDPPTSEQPKTAAAGLLAQCAGKSGGFDLVPHHCDNVGVHGK